MRTAIAIICTIAFMTLGFIIPIFWQWYSEYFKLENGELIAPRVVIVCLLIASFVGTIYSWARSFDKDLR